jgi:hypothetical protein
MLLKKISSCEILSVNIFRVFKKNCSIFRKNFFLLQKFVLKYFAFFLRKFCVLKFAREICCLETTWMHVGQRSGEKMGVGGCSGTRARGAYRRIDRTEPYVRAPVNLHPRVGMQNA